MVTEWHELVNVSFKAASALPQVYFNAFIGMFRLTLLLRRRLWLLCSAAARASGALFGAEQGFSSVRTSFLLRNKPTPMN